MSLPTAGHWVKGAVGVTVALSLSADVWGTRGRLEDQPGLTVNSVAGCGAALASRPTALAIAGIASNSSSTEHTVARCRPPNPRIERHPKGQKSNPIKILSYFLVLGGTPPQK